MPDTAIKERPLLMSGPMVRATLADLKTQTRRPVTPRNSTVLDYPAKPYWPRLLLDHATARVKSTLMLAIAGEDAPIDVHLSVPFLDPDLEDEPIDELPRYRVRPIVEVGDRFWVRESAYIAPPRFGDPGEGNCTDYEGRRRIVGYAATMDGESIRCATDYGVNLTPSIHVPRWASRLTLEVTDVRVERLNDISEEDARAEGMTFHDGHDVGHTGWRHDVNHGYVYPNARAAFSVLWELLHGKGSWAINDWLYVYTFKRLATEDDR